MDKQAWISAKIKKLEHEDKGRSHEQNIAIAFSMYEHMHQNGGFANRGIVPIIDWSKDYLNQDGSIPPVIPNTVDPTQMPTQAGTVLNKPAIPNFDTPEGLGFSSYTQTPENYAKTLDGAMLTNEGEDFRKQVSQGEMQTEEDKKLQNNYNFDNASGKIQFFNPYGGVDLASAAGYLGQSIENNDTLGTVTSGLKLATGIGRNIFGAIGNERRKNQVMEDYYTRQKSDLTRTEAYQDGGNFFEDGGDINPPLKKETAKRFSTPLKQTMISITSPGIMSSEDERKSQAVQRPIHHIQKVETSEMKSGLQPGSYYKVYYTDPNKAKIENQDYEYVNSAGYEGLKTMSNFRIYNDSLKKSPMDNTVASTFQMGGAVIDKTFVPKPKMLPRNAPKRELSIGELSALAHQTAGEGQSYATPYVKRPGSIMNDVGTLSESQKAELEAYKRSLNPLEALYTLMPNAGRMFGDGFSAADLPLDSPLRKEDGGYFEEGGEMTLPKALTGEFMTGMDKENPLEDTNAEVETGEHIQHPTGEIQQVVGNTHEEGGEDVKLENGTKILSDHLKIGVVVAKQFEKEYDLKLKASDTYATVLDKYNKKIGLTKLVEEEEDYIEKLQKQKDETKDEEALGLNTQFLSEKINDITEKKKPLEEERKTVFEKLFKKQEDSKPKEKKDENYFEDGGKMIKEMADRYGVSHERAFKIAKQFKFQNGGEVNPLLVNSTQLTDFTNAPRSLQNLPYTPRETNPNAIWQGDNYNNVWTPLVEQSMSNPEDAKKIDEWLTTNKDTFSPNIQAQLQGLTGQTRYDKIKQLATDYKPGLFHNALLNALRATKPAAVTQQPEVAAIIAPEAYNPSLNIKDTQDSMSMLLLPDQNPMLPDSLSPHLKINRRFDRVNPALISSEQNIQELNRSKNAVMNDINNVPGAQRAAALIGLSANTDENINKAITETNKINSQITSNADSRNATIQATEENAAAQDALSYEQRQLRAKSLTDNDVRNYYNTLQANNVHNYEKVNEINLLNAMYNDFQFNGATVEKTSPNIIFGTKDVYTTPEERLLKQKEAAKKSARSKKNGGRFNN